MEPESKADSRIVQMVEYREGTLLYADPQRPSPVRLLGVLTAVAFHDPATAGLVQISTHCEGYTPAALEALAFYFVQNPAMKAVFDGMYLGRLATFAQQQPPFPRA
jgi:hypothetical protein